MPKKLEPNVVQLKIETCMKFVGAACIAKGMAGGQEMFGDDPMEGFDVYSQIGEPIIVRLLETEDESANGIIERCSVPEGLKDFILKTAREVVKLLEHA